MPVAHSTSSEDRIRELEATLTKADAINQMLKDSFESFDSAKVGNGWSADLLHEDVYAFKPIPPDAALAAAEQKKTGAFGTMGFFKPKPDEVKLVDKTLWYYPFWLVEGTHSIFYFRSASYDVPVQDDVLGTIVESKSRSLIAKEKSGVSRVLGSAGLIQRLLQEKAKHFSIGDVTEFAYSVNSATLFLDQQGAESEEFEELMNEKPPVVSAGNQSALKMRGVKTSVSETSGGKELILRRLQEEAVRKPKVVDRVWQNVMEVTRIELYYRPLYKYSFQFKDKVREVEIDGVPGKQ